MVQELPKGWIETSLDTIVLQKKGKKPLRLEPVEFKDSVPYLDIHALEKGIYRQYADINSSNIMDEDMIAIVWDGARSGWVSKGKFGAIGSTLAALKPINVDINYVFYYLQSNFSLINTNPRGIGIPHVDPTLLWNLSVPLPPLPEQQRIVAKLDTLFGHLDALKTCLDHIPQLLKDFRQKVLTQAVTGKLTEEWRQGRELEEWENKKLDDISERITVGYVGKMIDQYSDSGIPFLRSQNVRAFRFSDINLLYISAEFNEEIKKSKLYPGDVVIVRSGYPGTTCVIPETLVEANCSDILICTPKKKRLNPHFVSIFMNSDYGKEIVFQGRVGNAQQHFNTKTLKTTIIPLPPLVEQQEIVRRVESLFAKADQIEASYQKLKVKIEQLPQALLAKAFRGELVEQLPTDGDARDLLEQIKQAKADMTERKQVRSKKIEKKKIINIMEIETIIKENFKDKPFSFEELFNVAKIDYDVIQKDVFRLLKKNSGWRLMQEFDEKKKQMMLKTITDEIKKN